MPEALAPPVQLSKADGDLGLESLHLLLELFLGHVVLLASTASVNLDGGCDKVAPPPVMP